MSNVEFGLEPTRGKQGRTEPHVQKAPGGEKGDSRRPADRSGKRRRPGA